MLKNFDWEDLFEGIALFVSYAAAIVLVHHLYFWFKTGAWKSLVLAHILPSHDFYDHEWWIVMKIDEAIFNLPVWVALLLVSIVIAMLAQFMPNTRKIVLTNAGD